MNQHFVPRAYLKYFGKKRGKEYYVDVFDLKKEIRFNTNITNICAERDLYTLSADTEVAKDSQVVEKIYATALEPMYSKAHELLTTDQITVINEVQRSEILLGVFQLYMRNPRILNNSVQHHTHEITFLYKEAIKQGRKGLTYLNEDFSFREWRIEQIIEHFVEIATKTYKERHVIGIGEIGEFHQDARFEVAKIRGDSWFFTSDNPLVTDDMVTKDDNPLLKSKNFTMPLNPKYQLKIFHDKTIPRDVIGRSIMGSADVAIANGTLVGQSTRFIIGSQQSFDHYFAMIKAMNESPSKLIVDVMRQTIASVQPTSENLDLHELFIEYLKIHDVKGYLTEQEQQELHQRMSSQSKDWKKKRI